MIVVKPICPIIMSNPQVNPNESKHSVQADSTSACSFAHRYHSLTSFLMQHGSARRHADQLHPYLHSSKGKSVAGEIPRQLIYPNNSLVLPPLPSRRNHPLHRTAGGGEFLLWNAPGFISEVARFHRQLHRSCHADRVFCLGDGGIE
jgi:hypothetical protein